MTPIINDLTPFGMFLLGEEPVRRISRDTLTERVSLSFICSLYSHFDTDNRGFYTVDWNNRRIYCLCSMVLLSNSSKSKGRTKIRPAICKLESFNTIFTIETF